MIPAVRESEIYFSVASLSGRVSEYNLPFGGDIPGTGDSQFLNLLPVSRLVTVLDEADQCGVVCKLQEVYGGVFRCAVICVQGEEQWAEKTALRSSSADHTGAE